MADDRTGPDHPHQPDHPDDIDRSDVPADADVADRGGQTRHDPSAADVDAAFAEIVARWDTTGEGEGPTGRTDPTDPTNPTGPTDPAAAPTAPRHPAVNPPITRTVIPVWRGGTGGSVTDLLGDGGRLDDGGDDPPGEEFAPAPTQPLPPLSDRLFWGALGGLVLGPLLLLLLAVLGLGGGWLTGAGIVATIAGFACLVLRQPSHRGDDPHQGARV